MNYRNLTYSLMTPAELQAALDDLGLTSGQLAKLCNWRPDYVERMLARRSQRGQRRDIPHHLRVLLTVLRAYPGALEMAREITEEAIQEGER